MWEGANGRAAEQLPEAVTSPAGSVAGSCSAHDRRATASLGPRSRLEASASVGARADWSPAAAASWGSSRRARAHTRIWRMLGWLGRGAAFICTTA